MKKCLSILLMLLTSLALASTNDPAVDDAAEDAKCASHIALMVDNLYTLVQGVYQDIEAETQWIYWDRLGPIFRGLPPSNINRVFDSMSEQQFLSVYYANLRGDLRINGNPLTTMQERFLQDLYDFGIVDAKSVFWKETDPERRLVAIRQALDEIDTRNGTVVRLEDIGDRTETAVGLAEQALVTRGRHDTTRRQKDEPPRPSYSPMYRKFGITWDPLVRFIWSVYPRVNRGIAFTAQVRSRMQHAFLIDHVVIDAAIERGKELPFSQAELVALNYLLANTGTQIADAREDFKRVLGREPTVRDPITPNDINYYTISNNIEQTYNAHAEYVRDQKAGEDDLDRMHAVINAARSRLGLPPRRPDDYWPNELRFRHMQYDREVGTTERHHHRALDRATQVSYTVNYSWTVTYEKYENKEVGKDENGKAKYEDVLVKTWTETFSSRVSRTPSYRNILINEYDQSPGDTEAPFRGLKTYGTISDIKTTGTVGLREIESATQGVRQSETAIWNSLVHYQHLLYQHIKNHNALIERAKTEGTAINPLLAELQQSRADLEKIVTEFDAYRGWSASQVRSQWKNDVLQDFHARNDRLAARYRNLIKFYDIYEEQLRSWKTKAQGTQLEILYSTPNFRADLEVMRKRMIRNLIIKWTTSVGIAAATIGGVIYYNEVYVPGQTPHYSTPAEQNYPQPEVGERR